MKKIEEVKLIQASFDKLPVYTLIDSVAEISCFLEGEWLIKMLSQPNKYEISA
ncbi:hypothetical protein Riv7116_3495 [Rivularia sp. PCC 7116]|nr:hypothetical protein Riv7116_3495 [Rivularia sp. PCC 7116]